MWNRLCRVYVEWKAYKGMVMNDFVKQVVYGFCMAMLFVSTVTLIKIEENTRPTETERQLTALAYTGAQDTMEYIPVDKGIKTFNPFGRTVCIWVNQVYVEQKTFDVRDLDAYTRAAGLSCEELSQEEYDTWAEKYSQ